MRTKPSHALTLKDKLSRLSHVQAVRLLGANGEQLLKLGGKYDIDLTEQVSLTDDRFQLRLPKATVTLVCAPEARARLKWTCDRCPSACEHVGAAFALVLEEKTALGLAREPEEDRPLELLDEDALIRRLLAEREERARVEKMKVIALDPASPWTDYQVTSAGSGKTYRVALRGLERGASYCSCPDYRKNTLGTCKHLLFVGRQIKRRFPAARLAKPYVRKHLALHLAYDADVELRLLLPATLPPDIQRLVQPLVGHAIADIHDCLQRVRKIQARGHEVTIYPDAEEYIRQRLFRERIAALVTEMRQDPKRHPLRTTLLKTELLPYQLDGIAFAVGAGRAILADDMGLGKTIQGVGVAEMLAREAGIRKVLVVCPTSLKSQWRSEITRFSGREAHLVVGSAAERARQYAAPPFFTICNYEQVLRDLIHIEAATWDLIILDEGQRIKNWEAKTSRVIKALKSPFALALTGTPLENRLEELFSVAEFIDERRLGPAFHFLRRHRTVDERGKVLGYKNIGDLRERLKPILLRRTRESVMQDLPPRTTEIVRIVPTEEQVDLNATHMRVISSIVRKAFITEMDLLRLQKALLMCRMAADSTFLVDKQAPGYSSKLEKLDELLEELAAEQDRKILLFSEWTTMLDLIEPILTKRKLRFVRLDGSIPQRQRQQLVHEFQKDPACKAFITTNAGSTGLNLQAANTVINVDLPWNPAVLEQRIARAHRMGQKRPVQVYILVTEQTIEENLLATLALKKDLAMAALDPESTVDTLDMARGMEELKRRLEVLLGAVPEAPVDVSEQRRLAQEAEAAARRERLMAAAGQMLTAAFSFVNELVPAGAEAPAPAAIEGLHKSLSECLTRDAQGRLQLTVMLPDAAALAPLAASMARLAALGAAPAGAPATGGRL